MPHLPSSGVGRKRLRLANACAVLIGLAWLAENGVQSLSLAALDLGGT